MLMICMLNFQHFLISQLQNLSPPAQSLASINTILQLTNITQIVLDTDILSGLP